MDEKEGRDNKFVTEAAVLESSWRLGSLYHVSRITLTMSELRQH